MATAPKSAQQIREALKQQVELQGRHTEGLVSPTGDVAEIFCPPPEDGAENGPRNGDVQMAWINGAPRILKKFEDLGYRTLKDVCAADGVPERHEQWKAAIYARIVHKVPIRGNVDELYPPTVHRLRKLYREGGTAEGKAFVIGQGITDDPVLEEKRDKMAERVAALGIGDPRVQPEPTPKGKGKGTTEAGHAG